PFTFFFHTPPTTDIYTLSLHDALPILHSDRRMLELMLRNLLSNALRYTERGKILLGCKRAGDKVRIEVWDSGVGIAEEHLPRNPDRKSTRLNSSHVAISYAVFCLKKKI